MGRQQRFEARRRVKGEPGIGKAMQTWRAAIFGAGVVSYPRMAKRKRAPHAKDYTILRIGTQAVWRIRGRQEDSYSPFLNLCPAVLATTLTIDAS